MSECFLSSVSPAEGKDACRASSCIAPLLDDVLERATETLASGAYLHHYTKWGMEKEDLCESLVGLEQVHRAYAEL